MTEEPKAPFSDRLLGSSSVQSLLTEHAVYDRLRELGWHSLHGVFYRDSESGKMRELDATGTRTWSRSPTLGLASRLSLSILVEVKSAKGYNVVFSRLEERYSVKRLHRAWLGQGEGRKEISSLVDSIQMSGEDRNSLYRAFHDLFFAHQDIGREILALEAVPIASAFRETDTRNERDLDTAVFWRACQALRSSVEGLRQEFIARRFAAYRLLSSDARKAEAGGPSAALLLRELTGVLPVVELFHPIVVTGSPLWMLADGRLSECEVCRFVQQNSLGSVVWWADIVTETYSREYFRMLTQHYESEAIRLLLEPLDVERAR